MIQSRQGAGRRPDGAVVASSQIGNEDGVCMMPSLKVSGMTLVAAAAATLLSARAQADEPAMVAAQPGYDEYAGTAAPPSNPIPPNVEEPPVAATSGGYCYVGPHPTDTRVVPGPEFDEAQGQHIHPYPPIDLRLFSFRDGC